MEYSEIYRAVLKDGEFIGGNLKHTKWSKCPDGIYSLEIKLPYGDFLKLSGYEMFNFFIGASKSLRDGAITINHIHALGKREEMVTSYRITLIGSNPVARHKLGDITVRQFPFGKEGMGRTSTSGWKNGID